MGVALWWVRRSSVVLFVISLRPPVCLFPSSGVDPPPSLSPPLLVQNFRGQELPRSIGGVPFLFSFELCIVRLLPTWPEYGPASCFAWGHWQLDRTLQRLSLPLPRLSTLSIFYRPVPVYYGTAGALILFRTRTYKY